MVLLAHQSANIKRKHTEPLIPEYFLPMYKQRDPVAVGISRHEHLFSSCVDLAGAGLQYCTAWVGVQVGWAGKRRGQKRI